MDLLSEKRAITLLCVVSMILAVLPNNVNASGFAMASTSITTSPTGFEGLNQLGNGPGNRPDVQVAAGPNHVMEVVNQAVAIYNKQGTQLSQVPLNTFFQRGTDFLDDSMVIDDGLSQRWFATTVDTTTGSVVAAVSNSNDPTLSWHYYTIGGSGILCYDRARIGLSSDKFVVTAWSLGSFYAPVGQCAGNGGPRGEQYWVMNKSDMVNGASNVNNFTITPTQSLGYGMQPMQAIGSINTIYIENAVPSGVSVIRIDGLPPGPLTNSTATIITSRGSPLPPSAPSPSSDVVDTSGRFVTLASLSWLNGRLWSAYNVECTPPGDTTTRSCIQMLQLNTTSSQPTILQDFVFGVKGQYYFYPELSFDGTGNMDLLFGFSNSTTYPSLALSGQAWNDPVNAMAARLVIKQGSSCCPNNEWGDYMGAGLDPSDPTVVWTAGEYMIYPAAFPSPAWSTFIASEKLLPSDFSICCDFSVSSVPGRSSVVSLTLTSLNNFAGTIAFSASSLPTGYTTSFNPTTVTVTAGRTATDIFTLKLAANGTCSPLSFTVTAKSGPNSHSVRGRVTSCPI